MKQLVLLFFLLSAQLANSQAFEPGYLVLQRGDTLRGQVENAFWEEPPRVVRFRPAATAPTTAYAARQLRGVGLASGRLLRNEPLPIDYSAESRITYLPSDATRRQQADSVLADVLVLGPASLLGISLHDTRHFFVQRPGQPYLEMAERKYLKSQIGTQSVVDANDFRTQLLLYLGDCEAATSLLATTPFTDKGLRRVVQAFNQQCSGAHQAGQEIREYGRPRDSRIVVRVGLTAGVRYNSLKLSAQGQVGTLLDGAEVDGQLHPQGGVYADLVSGGRKLALHTAVLFSSFGNSSPKTFTGPTSATTGQYQWNGTQVAIQLGLRGLLPIGPQLRLLVGGGYEVNSFSAASSFIKYDNASYSFVEYLKGGMLPYLEAGLSRNRLALNLNARLYKNDELNLFSYSHTYTYQPWSLSLAFSYHLIGHSDGATAAHN